ncbi:ABC transporter permease [Bifidobacterium moukalabense]|uniref:ABC transporter permease n=1 Tax=Bifidobacterium moukalabense TaxID=1333651 RepID=UPI0010F8D19C|nr:ABC transporter permease [Bifidobacterium moukalabense]
MNTVGTIMRLRWALMRATMRKSTMMLVSYIIGAIFGVGALVGSVALGLMLGPLIDGPGGMIWQILRMVMVLGGTFTTVIVIIMQIMYFGQGTAMNPHRFELYGIDDRTLTSGLFLSGLTGMGAIWGILILLGLVPIYQSAGTVGIVAGAIAVPLAVVTILALSKLVISLLSTLTSSSSGKSTITVITILLFVVLCQVPGMVMNSQDMEHFSFKPFVMVADVFSWTPLGAAFQLPFDVVAGSWGPAALRLLILVATWAVCYLGCLWCLKKDRTIAGAATRVAATKGIGLFSMMPDSPSGAISARMLTYLRRDPRQAPMLFMPLLFIVIFTIESRGMNVMIWQSIIWSGFFLVLLEGNGLSYDGRGFTMEVISGVRGVDDRLGRVRVYAIMTVAYIAVLMVIVYVITGDWRSMGGLATGLVFGCLSLCLGFCGLGLAEVVSCVFMYPVPSISHPFSSPQGRVGAQMLFPFLHMFGMILLMLPTGIVALVLGLTGNWDLYWLLAPVALVNGAAVLAIGTWLGGKLLEARMPRILATLDSFASLQQ